MSNYQLNLQQQPAPFTKFALNLSQNFSSTNLQLNQKPINNLISKMAIPVAQSKSNDEDDSSEVHQRRTAPHTARSQPIDVPLPSGLGRRAQPRRQSMAGSPPRHDWDFERDYQRFSEHSAQSLVTDDECEDIFDSEEVLAADDSTSPSNVSASEARVEARNDERDITSTRPSRPQALTERDVNERVLRRRADLASRRNASISNASLAPIYADIMKSLWEQPMLIKETVLDDPRSLEVFSPREMNEIADMVGYSLRAISIDYEQSRAHRTFGRAPPAEPREVDAESVVDGQRSSPKNYCAAAARILAGLSRRLLNLAQVGVTLLMDIVKRALSYLP